MPDRTLTEHQHAELERISRSAAGQFTRIIGWAQDGPLLQIRNDVAVLRANGILNAVRSSKEEPE